MSIEHIKKIILVLLTTSTAISIMGCGGISSDSTQANNNSGIESPESVENASWTTYDGPSTTKDEWESDPLLTELPYPEMDNINIHYESSTWTDIFVYEPTQSQFNTYGNKCKSAGFTTDLSFDSSFFMAKKGDSELTISRNPENRIMEISYTYPEK